MTTKSLWEILTTVRNNVLEEAAQACEAKKVDAASTGATEDAAYNTAIIHCVTAIRALKSKP